MGYKINKEKDNAQTINKLLGRSRLGIDKYVTCFECLNEHLPNLKIGFEVDGKYKEITANSHEELKNKILNDKEIAIMTIEKGNGYSTAFNDKVLEDKDVVVCAFKHTPFISLKNMPWSVRSDNDVIMAALESNGMNYEYISPEVAGKSEYILAAVRQGLFDFDDFPKWVRDDKRMMIDIVAIKGTTLQYASDTLKNDIDVVKTAVLNDRKAINFASDIIKEDITLINDIAPNFDDYYLEPGSSQNKYQFIAYTSSKIEKALLAQTEYSKNENIGVYEVCMEVDLSTKEMSPVYALFAEYENPETKDFGNNLPFYSERDLSLTLDDWDRDTCCKMVEIERNKEKEGLEI